MGAMVEITILLAAAVVAVSLFTRFGLGAVLGYLAAGVAIGPHGLRFVTDVESIMHVSELGVVFLLFLIGLELQPSRLWVLRRTVFGLGSLQCVLTTLLLSGLGGLLGLSFGPALAVGFALSLSSTAFVLQILAERREQMHAYARSAFGILLFQDLAVIPFLAVLPLLGDSGPAPHLDVELFIAVGKIILAFAAVTVAGAYLVRPLLRYVASSRTHEIFTATTLLLVLATALFMESVGLSMALGAFLAGVLLANTEYRHELQANIEPFSGLLLGLFFIAVGMSANFAVLRDQPFSVFGLSCAIVLVKACVLFVVGRSSRLSSEASFRLALALPQSGEFAFVIFSLAVAHQLIGTDTSDLLVMVVTVSMALTPLLFRCADWLAPKLLTKSPSREFDRIDEHEPQVVIAGFGRVGQIVARILRVKKIAFTALEANQEQVDFVRRFGSKIYYGDASRLDLLRAAAIDKAKVFVLAIDDMDTSLRTAELVRRHFPQVTILARARNRQHAYRLMDLGITYVIRETLGSSIEMGVESLKILGLSATHAGETARIFREHDDRSLVAAHAVHRDERKLVEAAKQYAKELESIFEADESNRSRDFTS